MDTIFFFLFTKHMFGDQINIIINVPGTEETNSSKTRQMPADGNS